MANEYGIYDIAGLKVKIEGMGEQLNKRMSEYVLPLPKEGEHTYNLGVNIRKTQDKISLPENFRQVHSGAMWNLIETDNCQGIYKTLKSMEDEVSLYIEISQNKAEISLLSISDDDCKAREYAFSGYAMSQLLLQHNRLVLHSSCISTGGQAILFSAPSGTGKSTHTGLWQKYVKDTVYINDDTPIIRLDSQKVYACGSPWSGKTDLNSNISSPLAGIVFLERGEKNTIEPIKGADAFARLLGETRKFPFRNAVEKATELCGELIERVPVFRLTCDISEEAVRVVHKAVLGK